MAHSCWALNEIVSCIAAILVSDEATASAVALARCSRSFEEPALRRVWRSLSSLAPLVKCFPPKFWEIKNGQLYLTRAPSSTEWTRFQQQYASKVRHLVVSSPGAVISFSALQMLQLYSHGGLLPNPVSLDWTSDDSFLPFITSFVSRSLTSISIDGPAAASRILPPILTRLPTMAPDISEIKIRNLRRDLSLEEASSQLLMQCNPHRLRSYIIYTPLSASALSHVIQLPFLEEFWLEGSFHFPDPLPDVVFPSLKSLDIELSGDLDWLRFLPQTSVLSSIRTWCPRDVAQFMEKFQAITTKCGMHERLQEFTVFGLLDFQITPQIIACNLSFKNLTLLKFSSNCGTHCRTQHLTDADIDLLADAMRGIQTLAIGEQPCGVPSKITFKSLYTLSRRCTRLTTLQIHFNPTSFINKANADSRNGGFETPSSDLCSVTMIDAGRIALPRHTHASYTMVFGLLGVFPRLEEVKYTNVAWKEISKLIEFRRRVNTAFVSG